MTSSGFPIIKILFFITFVVSLVVTGRFLKVYAIEVQVQFQGQGAQWVQDRINEAHLDFDADQTCWFDQTAQRQICVPAGGGGGGGAGGSDPAPEADDVTPVDLTGCPASIYKGQSTNAIRVNGGSGDYELSKNPNVGTLSRSGAVVTYTVPANTAGNPSVIITAEDEEDHDNEDSCPPIAINNPPPVTIIGCPTVMVPGQTMVGIVVGGGPSGVSYGYSATRSGTSTTVGTFNGTSYVASADTPPYAVTLKAWDLSNPLNFVTCPSVIDIVEPLNITNCPTGHNGLGYTPEQGGPQTYQFSKTGSCGPTGCIWEVQEREMPGNVVITEGQGSIDDTDLYTKGSGVTNQDFVFVTVKRADYPIIQAGCSGFTYKDRQIGLSADDQPPAIMIGGDPFELQYSGGPSNREFVRWELLSGSGSLNPDTGVYTPSDDYDDIDANDILVNATDEVFPANWAMMTFTYTPPPCEDNFGIYDYRGNPVALQDQTVTKGVYPGVTYRFFVKNAIVRDDFEANTFAPLAVINDVPMTFSQGVSENGEPYFDFQFTEKNASSGHSFPFIVWDSNADDGVDTCKATLSFEHRGLKLHAKNSRRVRMNNH